MSRKALNISYFASAWALSNWPDPASAVSLTTGNERNTYRVELSCCQHPLTRTISYVPAHNVNGGSFTDDLIPSELVAGAC